MVIPLLLLLGASPQISILASIDDAKPRPGWVYARAGQKVTLWAMLPGDKLKSIRWFKLEPVLESVDNTQPRFHFEPIEYRETELEKCRGLASCPAEVSVTVLPKVDQLPGVGTMAFVVKARTTPGGTFAGRGGGSPELVL